MKKQDSLLLFFLFLFVGFSQQINIWQYIELEDEKVIAENKEDTHASFTSFTSVVNAQENRAISKKS